MELSPSGRENVANLSWKSVYSEIDKYKRTEEKLRITVIWTFTGIKYKKIWYKRNYNEMGAVGI